MNLQEITDVLFEYVGTAFELDDDPGYTTDVNLFDEGYLDSLNGTELIMWVEERFGIEISQKDITLYPMNSIEEIANVIYSKRG